MTEEKFEKELIQYLSNYAQDKTSTFVVNDEEVQYSLKPKLWKYEPNIKTTEQLWENFKSILERHNQDSLDRPLSVVEFNQVKKVICDLHTPYLAGQFLYGLNGVSQIEVDLDDGRHVFLTVFDQKQVGAGDTVYQVVNQIERPAIISGKQNRRFDTTLLINGLPIIQIEEKRDTRDVNEALNQMHQYALENQYRDIFSTLQILVAITPNNVKYMANTTADKFNKDFAFNWQRKSDNQPVRKWQEFADLVLSIPMAHQMATNFMILDGTKNKQMLKVMRPYQVYATQKVIDGIKKADFEFGENKIGYVWHTTGSGKTITSFKTAWLASRMPNVDKVIFVVDRIALTQQTAENYKAYDPDAVGESSGVIKDTESTNDLSRKLKAKDNSIIVTSVQKLDTLVKRPSFKAPDKNFVFIVDEAHRSTGGESFKTIQKAFKNSAWVGYTGTPMFDNTTKGLRTEDIFGELLHAYTIREAIADRNVLGFKVDFKTTINETEMKEKYLPEFYREKYPKWTDAQIQNKINNLTQEDMDDTVEPSFYDENKDHIREVVRDIFENWRNRSNDGKYNALLTTHVGGGKASTPMAMMYFDEFQRVNEENRKYNLENPNKPKKQILKVAITYSLNTTNNDNMVATNENLHRAIKHHNQEFGTSFGLDDVPGYTQDVTSRLNKTAHDKNYLDLGIVVDQLLTGFDAPQMNTLYVDRTLKGAGLIQAYSRTNRVEDMQEKPWGRVINYRWPTENEKLMNEALAIYANKDSAKLTDEERKIVNKKDNITAPEFENVLSEVKEVLEKLATLTNDFVQTPQSEKECELMYELLKDYNSGMAKLKQYDPEDGNTGFDYNNPDELVEKLGITPEQEKSLTTVLKNELKEKLSEIKKVPYHQIEIRMTHIKDVKVNYDYLTELIEKLLNEVHYGKTEEATETKEKINQFANSLEDRGYAMQIRQTANAIYNGDYPPEGSNMKFPVNLQESESIIREANTISLDKLLQDFRIKWGIVDIVNSKQLRELFSGHRYEANDLDSTGVLTNIISEASKNYKSLAYDEEIQKMTKIKYRNSLREAIYQIADKLVEND